MDLKGKVVVITGAASGFGRAMAIEFFGRGCHLALIDIDRDGLRDMQSHFGRSEQRVTIHDADITEEKQVIIAQDEIIDRHRQVNILINNAGISISQEFVDIKLEDYRSLMNVNFWGTVFCTKYFLPSLKQQPNSRLVNIISDFALMGFPGKTAYASSKGAVMSFTNALKTELTKTSVKVCLVIPPPLDTGLIKNSLHVNEHKKIWKLHSLETKVYRSTKQQKR